MGTCDAVFAGAAGLGIHLNQAGSQSRLVIPVQRNTERQPNLAISRPAPNALTAGPSFNPAVITPLARPRFSCATFSAMTLEVHGNATDSPTPSNKRSDSRATKPPAKPVAMVAKDQSRSPALRTRFAPKRSTMPPTTNCKAV